MDENKLKHLEFIQIIISRMAQNSFYIKGWTVTLVAGLFVFANVKEMDYKFIIIAYLPSIFFWCLDGYFLWQEKLYRKLYDYVRVKEPRDIDFSMDISSLNTQTSSWGRVFFSSTLLMFYIPILIVIFLAMLFACNLI